MVGVSLCDWQFSNILKGSFWDRYLREKVPLDILINQKEFVKVLKKLNINEVRISVNSLMYFKSFENLEKRIIFENLKNLFKILGENGINVHICLQHFVYPYNIDLLDNKFPEIFVKCAEDIVSKLDNLVEIENVFSFNEPIIDIIANSIFRYKWEKNIIYLPRDYLIG